jgi:hypothetical protein
MSRFVFTLDQLLEVLEIHRVLRHRRLQEGSVVVERRRGLHGLAVRRPRPEVRLGGEKIGRQSRPRRGRETRRRVLSTQPRGHSVSRNLPSSARKSGIGVCDFLKCRTMATDAGSSEASAGIYG